MLLCTEGNCNCPHHIMLYYLSQDRTDDLKQCLPMIKDFDKLADNSGKTLLRYAVDHWNKEMVQYLIEAGSNVDARDDCGVSPLMMAIQRGERIVEILLKNGADVYATNSHGTSVFELAIHGTLDISRSCEASSASSSIRILQMIVDRVNDDFSKGSLEQWLSNANNVIKLILVTFGSEKLIRFLLANGYPIDRNDQFTERCTALHCAMAMARLENVKILIEHGANVDALDKEGCSPLYYYSPNFDDIDENSELLIRLLTCSNGLSATDRCSFKSLERLLTRGKENTVRWTILLSGIDAKTCLADGIFGCLVRNRNEGILDILDELNVKFQPNECTTDGYTILAEAVRSGCPRKVEFLLQHGADVNMISPQGQSALMYVNTCPMGMPWRANATKIVELLLQYGSVDAQSLFLYHYNLSDKFCSATRVILAHLALLHARDRSSLTVKSWQRINSYGKSKAHFRLCAKQLEDMKGMRVYWTVTFFKLLTESDGTIAAYARNQPLLLSFKSMKKRLRFEPYYLNFAQKRLSRALYLAELQDKVAPTIETLTGIRSDVYHSIVYTIISYLDRHDLKNLCEIEKNFPLK